MSDNQSPREIEMRKMKAEGFTYADIGKAFNMTASAVSGLLKIQGVVRSGPCEDCKKDKLRLIAHHTNYITNEYKMVCSRCHAKYHKRKLNPSLHLRLNGMELEMLDKMIESNDTVGFESRSDFFRLLLWREWNRRKQLGPPRPEQYQGKWRVKGAKPNGSQLPAPLVCQATAPDAA